MMEMIPTLLTSMLAEKELKFCAFEKGLGGRDLNRKRVRVTGVGGGVGANQTTYWYQNRKIMRRGSWEPGIIHLEKVFSLSKKGAIQTLPMQDNVRCWIHCRSAKIMYLCGAMSSLLRRNSLPFL